MPYQIKTFLSLLTILGISSGFFSVPAHSQEFRERIKERIMEQRMKERESEMAPPPKAANTTEVFLDVNGEKRSYFVHKPANSKAGYLGAVLVFHGGGGDAKRMISMNNMPTVSDKEGFVTAFVQTVRKGVRWQDGRDETYRDTDDVEYVRAVIRSLGEKYNVDPNRVFATGVSNGGAFINRLACEAPGLVKGIAPVAANMSINLNSICTPSKGTPIIMFSGTDDPLMPFEGGKGDPPPMIKRAMEKQNLRPEGSEGMLSSHATAKFWASKNGCTKTSSADLPDRVDDGTSVTVITHDDCRDGKAVLYQINGGGHSWPGPTSKELKIIGTTSREIDASQVMVDFFKSYGL